MLPPEAPEEAPACFLQPLASRAALGVLGLWSIPPASALSSYSHMPSSPCVSVSAFVLLSI